VPLFDLAAAVDNFTNGVMESGFVSLIRMELAVLKSMVVDYDNAFCLQADCAINSQT
jgi:hypothetical protein